MRHLKAPALLLAILISAFLFPVCALAAPEADPEIETVINIYHTNDVHGHVLGNDGSIGYARFKTYVKEDPADGKLVMDAGDAFSGSAFANLSDGASVSELMDAVGYHAFVPGSHDFGYGDGQLQALVEASGANGLALNLLKDGQPLFPAYHIFQKNGVKIGVLGIVSPDAPAANDPDRLSGLTFLGSDETIVAAQEAVAALQAEEVNAIVALTHLGASETATLSSVDIATSVSGIDLIIDGNSHGEYENGLSDYPGYIAGVTPPIAQAGRYFESFGVAALSFDADNNLLSVSDSLIDYETAVKSAPDKKIAAIVTDYTREQQSVLEKRIASTPVFLNGEAEYTQTGCSGLGVLAAASMLESTGADIAVLNSGSILSSIPEGDITFGAMYNALSFDRYVVTTKITGAELKELLNRQLVYHKSGFPQIAGFTVESEQYLTDAGNPAAKVTALTRNGRPIGDDDILTVAVLDYMYHGGDDYAFSSPLIKEYDTLFHTVVSYLNEAPEQKIESFSDVTNIVTWEETIDADAIISKLKLPVPSDVRVYLNQSSTIPESVLYNLIDQDRYLVFSIRNERPYSFVFDGTQVPSPMNASLVANVSQEVPTGKRPASSADKDAIFVDLSKNQALPPDTSLYVYVGDVYQPGSLVYLYYYDLNRDILPLDTDGIRVDSSGNISFPVVGGTTYLVNSRKLNASTLFEAPTPSNPFIPGIAVVLIVFSAWVVFFLITKRGSQKNET